MSNARTILRWLISALMGVVVTHASVAQQLAQPLAAPLRAPSTMSWRSMALVVFESTNFKSTGTEADRQVLSNIWRKELAQAGYRDPAKGQRFPSFVLIGAVEQDSDRYVLSIYQSARYDCELAPNGASANQLYAKCPLRVSKFSANGRTSTQDFPGYCMLFVDDPDNPRQKNHIEYAFDRKTATVFLRTIQYGKEVGECSRSIRLTAG
ncbi:hypothetical protein NU688_32955 [Variovorax sp. ZS18.2.2]|uniref:hypothetical protein n=1 Tax=Variovorax sp. ZS18.2.2 TaxID=2971255 RepID=UPI002150E171|nr:hypothetical protein [Variovorax sp. ZS18.2.2]MCR6481007.1 hypothetical protein [Variovorax sp. ZS18.2.2]